jgi:outer membrane receptor protein involved in Fe transport
MVTAGDPRLARADDVADEADHLFTLGAERYQANDHKGALQYFLASNRLVRNRNVMFNIARTYEHVKQFPDAYRYYQRALEGETDVGQKARIKEAMARIAQSVALLEVKSDPPGALVYVNRKDLGDRGAAPQTLALPPGNYTVFADLPGYEESAPQKVEVRVGAEKTVTLKLTRVVGTVKLLGADGAEVRLDTDDAPVLCRAPCTFPSPPGQHTLVLTRAGFRTTRVGLVVKPNATNEIKPELEPETGSVVVNADEKDAEITVDGRTAGFTPAVVQVPVGGHDLRVVLRGFRPVTRRIDVKANEQIKLDLQLLSAESVEAASRVAEPIEDAPASVSLVPSPELRAMRYPTVAEALRGTRGVYVSDDRAYRSLGFRGFSRPGDYGNRVLVLVDGHPTNDNWVWSSYVSYDQRTDLEDIDRIEVVRGPGSVLYGTGAFSGVVNLVTTGRDTPEGREVGVGVADDGVGRARARYTQRFGSDSGVTVSAGAARSSGRDLFFPEYARDTPKSVAGNARGLDGLRAGMLTGRFWAGPFTVQWLLNAHDKDLPTGQFRTIIGDGRTHQTDTRGFVEAKLEPKLTGTLESVTRLHGNYAGYHAVFARAPDEGGVENQRFDGSWVGGEQRFIWKPIPILRVTGGGEAQHHFLAHQRGRYETTGTYFDDKRTFSVFAGYGMADVTPTPKLKLSAGARFDSYTTFGASLNPRIALIVKPYDGGNIKVLGGKAFRAPSIYELYNVSGGGQKESGESLGAENMYSGEIEYSHRFTRGVTGLVSGYANYITDLIALRDLPDATPTNPSYAYQNTSVPVGTVGGELELRREWREGWSVGASYSFQKSRYLADSGVGGLFAFDKAPGLREVPNAPSHLASLKGGVPILSRALVLMTRLSFEAPRFDRNDRDGPNEPGQGKTPSAVLWDFVFSGSETRWGLTYAVGVYNALDAQWSVPISAEYRQTTMPQSGRTLLATAGLTF